MQSRRLAVPIVIPEFVTYRLTVGDEEFVLMEHELKKLLSILHANGETVTVKDEPTAIPCQAEGSVESTSEGVETRDASNASSNRPHECPATQVVEDIVQSSGKLESGDKELHEDIARA